MAFGRDRGVLTAQARLEAQRADMAVDAGLRAYMLKVYNYMCTGLVLSGFVALSLHMTDLGALFYARVPGGGLSYTGLGWVAIFAPLGILLMASFAGARMSASATQLMYWAFVTLQGVGLSVLLEVYTGGSIARVFFITAAAFAGLSLWGYVTKKDLSGFGSFLIMGLFGLIIAMIVNIFLASPMMMFVISAAGVLIFAGLIAYDTQRIKLMYYEGMGAEHETKTAVWAALALYINFINLMQFLLMFLGNRE